MLVNISSQVRFGDCFVLIRRATKQLEHIPAGAKTLFRLGIKWPYESDWMAFPATIYQGSPTSDSIDSLIDFLRLLSRQ